MRQVCGKVRVPAPVCLAVFAALCVAGCLGARDYAERATYALRPEPSLEKAAPTDLVIGVRPLEGTEAIRDEIAYREEDFRLRYYETARWAEPPADLVTRALKDALAASGRFADVGDSRDLRPDLLLTGELRVFEELRAADGRFALATARFEVRRTADDSLVWADTPTARIPVEGDGLGALAAAMNRAVAAIVERATAAVVERTGQ